MSYIVTSCKQPVQIMSCSHPLITASQLFWPHLSQPISQDTASLGAMTSRSRMTSFRTGRRGAGPSSSMLFGEIQVTNRSPRRRLLNPSPHSWRQLVEKFPRHEAGPQGLGGPEVPWPSPTRTGPGCPGRAATEEGEEAGEVATALLDGVRLPDAVNVTPRPSLSTLRTQIRGRARSTKCHKRTCRMRDKAWMR